jgi:hypothetical protein
MTADLHTFKTMIRSLTQASALTGDEAERASTLLIAERTIETRKELGAIVLKGVNALLDSAFST